MKNRKLILPPLSERCFYRVLPDLRKAPTADYFLHGYETEHDFHLALRRLCDLWHGRIGEAMEERNGFTRLAFHDTPGGRPDQAWLPDYLLEPSAVPDYLIDTDLKDPMETELNEAFGFD